MSPRRDSNAAIKLPEDRPAPVPVRVDRPGIAQPLPVAPIDPVEAAARDMAENDDIFRELATR